MSWGDEFWTLVYESREYFRFLWAFLVLMLLLSAVAFAFGRPGTASRAIAYVNLGMIVGLTAVAIAMFWYAARRRDP
jgi:lipopolysaccharide export LptBFGC system permease protein LptF